MDLLTQLALELACLNQAAADDIGKQSLRLVLRLEQSRETASIELPYPADKQLTASLANSS